MRSLMAGCTTFSAISAGAPGLSHSLLTQRLRLLERVGIIEARRKPSGHGCVYALTESGPLQGSVHPRLPEACWEDVPSASGVHARDVTARVDLWLLPAGFD